MSMGKARFSSGRFTCPRAVGVLLHLLGERGRTPGRPGKKDPEFSVAVPARGHRAPWSFDVGTLDLGEYTIVYLSVGEYNMPLLLKFYF